MQPSRINFRRLTFLKRAGLLFLICCCWFCQKKLFGKIEVHGRVINFFTKKPIQTLTTLLTDDVNVPGETTELDRKMSDSDGSFSLSSRPSKRSAYYLATAEQGDTTRIDVVANKNNDLGNIETGHYYFSCMIDLDPVSDSCIEVFNAGAATPGYQAYPAGTADQVYIGQVYTKQLFEQNGGNFVVSYRKRKGCGTSGASAYRNYEVRVKLESTPMYVKISY